MFPARSLTRAAVVTIVLVAAWTAWTLASLPPRRVAVTGRWAPLLPTPRVRGVYHVHTTRSDGTGTVEEVARAAGRARLDFLVLTDHGDGTRRSDRPRYIDNVLVIDAVEVSTRLGHLAVIGLPGPAPYRLAGWPDEVVEDARRWGAVTVAAHPDSPRRSLSWRDWNVDVHGLEWLNADSEWRDESRWALARLLAAYPWRPPEAIASLFNRPSNTLARWDRLASEGRFLMVLAGADAHARLGFRDTEDEEDTSGWALRVPGYEQIFRAFSTVAELEQPFGRDAEADAAALVRALAAGRSYTVIDGWATPGRLEFFGRHPAGIVRMGQRVPEGTAMELVARASAPAGAEIRLLRNGEVVATSTGLELDVRPSTWLEPGERGAAFRVEVLWPPDRPEAAPWMLTNPIFVEPARERSQSSDGPSPREATVVEGVDLRSCTIEKDQVSSAQVHAPESGDDLTLDFQLAEAPTAWVALACSLPRPLEAGEGLQFEGSASRALRVDLQVREESAGDRRWGRSVPLDTAPARATVWLDRLRPVSDSLPPHPSGQPRRLLVVIDRLHAVAGMRGQLVLRRLRLVTATADEASPHVRTVSSR